MPLPWAALVLLFLGIDFPPLCVIKWRSSRPFKFTAPIAAPGVPAPGAVYYSENIPSTILLKVLLNENFMESIITVLGTTE